MTKRMLNTKKDFRRLKGVIAENAIALTLNPAAGAITAAARNVVYAGVTFAAPNAVGSTAFSIDSGALPVGMTLNGKTGLLSGTPTSPAGAFAFSVRATDQYGNSKVQAYTLALAA